MAVHNSKPCNNSLQPNHKTHRRVSYQSAQLLLNMRNTQQQPPMPSLPPLPPLPQVDNNIDAHILASQKTVITAATSTSPHQFDTAAASDSTPFIVTPPTASKNILTPPLPLDTMNVDSSYIQSMIDQPRPKRPLSAFNLFYRYKRTKILEAYKSPDPKCKDIDYIKSLITCPPGLESYIPSPSSSPESSSSLQDELSKLSSTQRTDISRTNIQSALKDNLTPNDTRDRMHRKTHGCMSFVEMSRIMSSAWKAIDDINKAVFEELAVQGRIIHAAKLAEYEKYNPPTSSKKSSSSSCQSQSPQQQQLSLEISAMIERSQQEPPPPGSVLVWSHPSSQSLSSGVSMGSGKKSVSKKARGLEAGKSAGSSMSSSSGGSSSSSSKKKKRDKPSMESQIVKPKRPLSAYNLFYRYKRVKILKAYTSKGTTKEDIAKLITSVPGLEDYPNMKYDPNSFDHVKDICRAEIRSLLEHNLSPNETRDRVHRKSHGYMSFTEMSKIMCDSWKVIDDYTKSVFEELAQQGRKMYQVKVVKYEKAVKEEQRLKKQKLALQAAAIKKNKKLKKVAPPPQVKKQGSHPDFDQLCNPNMFQNLDMPRGAIAAMQRQQQQGMPGYLGTSMMIPAHMRGVPMRIPATPSSTSGKSSPPEAAAGQGGGNLSPQFQFGTEMEFEPLPMFPNIFDQVANVGGRGNNIQQNGMMMDNVPQRILVSNTDQVSTSSTTSSEGNRIRSPSSSNSSSNSLDRAMLGEGRSRSNTPPLPQSQPNAMLPPMPPLPVQNASHYRPLYSYPRPPGYPSSSEPPLSSNPSTSGISGKRTVNTTTMSQQHQNSFADDLSKMLPAGNNSPIGNIRGGSISTGTPNSANSSRVGLDDFLESILNE